MHRAADVARIDSIDCIIEHASGPVRIGDRKAIGVRDRAAELTAKSRRAECCGERFGRASGILITLELGDDHGSARLRGKRRLAALWSATIVDAVDDRILGAEPGSLIERR